MRNPRWGKQPYGKAYRLADNPKEVWELPNPTSVHEVQVEGGSRIILRRHGNPAGPRLVMSHGNGLAIDLYYPFWSLLAGDFDLFIYDLRNHGWNEVGSLENHNVPTLASDHDAVLEAIEHNYGEKPQVGVFHSISALVSLLSPLRGSRYSALVLFDPPLCKPGRGYQEFEAAAIQQAGLTRSRTEKFRKREDLAGVLPFSPTFKRFVPGAFDLMARTTLRERKGEPGFELCCPREYEAQIVDYASAFGGGRGLRHIAVSRQGHRSRPDPTLLLSPHTGSDRYSERELRLPA